MRWFTYSTARMNGSGDNLSPWEHEFPFSSGYFRERNFQKLRGYVKHSLWEAAQ